jgi:class 3 adenylate cyclase
MQEKSYVLQDATLRDFFGNVVNVASRMESKVADPEGIAFSSVGEIPKELLEKFGAVGLSDKPNLKGANADAVYKISA